MASVHEMASVHVVGDLLGASGLSSLSGQEAFSVAHVLDLLSLHPSTELSYFCKWRLVVDEPTRSSREKASWKVLQGETHGQTQVHAASSGGSLAMPDLHRHGNRRIALPMMDTVWAHPIELHLATSNADAWKCWPRLEFQVRRGCSRAVTSTKPEPDVAAFVFRFGVSMAFNSKRCVSSSVVHVLSFLPMCARNRWSGQYFAALDNQRVRARRASGAAGTPHSAGIFDTSCRPSILRQLIETQRRERQR
jgi:hypothetical protein